MKNIFKSKIRKRVEFSIEQEVKLLSIIESEMIAKRMKKDLSSQEYEKYAETIHIIKHGIELLKSLL